MTSILSVISKQSYILKDIWYGVRYLSRKGRLGSAVIALSEKNRNECWKKLFLLAGTGSPVKW